LKKYLSNTQSQTPEQAASKLQTWQTEVELEFKPTIPKGDSKDKVIIILLVPDPTNLSTVEKTHRETINARAKTVFEGLKTSSGLAAQFYMVAIDTTKASTACDVIITAKNGVQEFI